jgi:hypothetical protein
MPRKRLTEEGVAKLKLPPQGKQIDYYDAHMPGLVLRVNYGGAKIWRALYYVKVSIPTTFKLGRYPALKLKEAREKVRRFLDNPHKAKARAASGSFQQVAENFVARHVEAKGKELRTAREVERIIAKYLIPRWRDRPFEEIKRSDVADLRDTIQDENGPRMADYVLAIVRTMMNWYAIRNDDYRTPIVRGMRIHGNHRRDRFLSDDEIRALWGACEGMGAFGALVQSC